MQPPYGKAELDSTAKVDTTRPATRRLNLLEKSQSAFSAHDDAELPVMSLIATMDRRLGA